MRIALLQESFCLIGFSGEDSNFISWVNWVRKLLWERSNSPNKTEDHKVYFIDCSKSPSEKYKELFFRNNNIFRISLFNDNVLTFLKQYQFDKCKNEDLIKQALFNLFNFLTGPKKQTDTIWSKLNHIIVSSELKEKKQNLKDILGLYQNLKLLNIHNRLAIIPYASEFPNSFFYYLKIAKSDSEKVQLFGFLAHSIRDCFSTISIFFNGEKLKKLKNIFESFRINLFNKSELNDYKAFIFMMLMNSRVTHDEQYFKYWLNKLETCDLNEQEKNRKIYEKALFFLYEFDYENLEKILEKWEPEKDNQIASHWVLKKTYLLAVSKTDRTNYLQLLEDYEENVKEENQNEQFLYYEILNYHYRSRFFIRGEFLKPKIDSFKSKGYFSVKEKFDFIIPLKKKEILPYEKQSAVKLKGWQFGHSGKDEVVFNHLQSIEFLLEAGLPLNINRTYFVDTNRFMESFQVLFKYIPKLMLSLSLQYADTNFNVDFIKRVAQEIAYADELKEDLPELFIKLANAFKYFSEKYETIKEEFLFVIAEFLIALPYENWKSFFKSFWVDIYKSRKYAKYFNEDIMNRHLIFC